MNAELRQFVRERANSRCEYCLLPQAALEQTLHVEHIIARQHHGSSDAENLALSCDRCNLFKGPNLTAIDPDSSEVVPLFHPRKDNWTEHFQLVGLAVVGLTPTGRATARLLQMNVAHRQKLRLELTE